MENKKLPASYRIALGQIKRYFGDSKPTEKEVKNYMGRISGPILDRMDLYIEIKGEEPCATLI